MNAEDITIIVAEDSVPNRRIVVQLLKKLQFQVVECEDGEAAWDALEEIEKIENVAIISDIMMPRMDGLELLKKVRGEEKTAKIPFVFVSTLTDKKSILEAKRLNANGYLLKPITFENLKAKVSGLFPNVKFKEYSV